MGNLSSFDVSLAERARANAAHRRAIGAYDRATLATRQRRAAIELHARYWLSRLDSHSSEAHWFARFARSYASSLDAAIAYLDACDDISSR